MTGSAGMVKLELMSTQSIPEVGLHDRDDVAQHLYDMSGSVSLAYASSRRSMSPGRHSRSSNNTLCTDRTCCRSTLVQEPKLDMSSGISKGPKVNENDGVNQDHNGGGATSKDRGPNWTVLSNALDDYDRAILDEGKDVIDTFLIFAGIFSAMMTVISVASLFLLQEKPTDSTAIILAQISQQLGSLSIDAGHITSIQPPYTPPDRSHDTASHIVISILWCTSLVLALISASLGILIKQWLKGYAAKTSGQQMENMCIRQLRFEGLVRWRVGTIMGLLPLLLQIALLLFFGGLSTLLWTLSTPVATVVTALTSVWLIIWSTTMCLPTFYPDCPYKSAESAIVFTLIQSAKLAWYSAMGMLAHCLYRHVGGPGNLGALFKNRKAYSNWYDREKDVVQTRMAELSQRTILCADEVLMDESLLDVAVRSYVKTWDAGSNVDLLLSLFLKSANCSKEELEKWIPDGSRRTRSLIRIMMDALADTYVPSSGMHEEHRNWNGRSRDGDILHHPQWKRELLVTVLGNYIYFRRNEVEDQEMIRGVLHLPLHVNFRGLSVSCLRDFTRKLWLVQAEGRIVKNEVIDVIAECAAHAYNSGNCTAMTSDNFVLLCHHLICLLADTAHDEMMDASTSSSYPLQHLGEMFAALGECLTRFKDTLPRLYDEDIIFEDLQRLASRHPSLKHDVEFWVRGLSAQNEAWNPYPDRYTLERAPHPWNDHQNTLNIAAVQSASLSSFTPHRS